MNSIFIDVLNGKKVKRPPVWFMRQAGRILPSYQNLKLKYTFDELMKDKKLAAEVTLLPIDDLGVDTAILFSDILIIPESLGLRLEFTDRGPKFFNPITENSSNKLILDTSKLDHVYSNIKQVKNQSDVPLIGFCGGPLTTFLFMFRGEETDKSFKAAIDFFNKNKSESLKIMDKITEVSIEYVKSQIKAGIDCFQLFETYCGIIPSEDYKELILPFSIKILKAAKGLGTPTIFFPKNFNSGLKYINNDICDFVGIDSKISLEKARQIVDQNVGIQGNMDPRIFYTSYDEIQNYLESLVNFGSNNNDWIFNIGRGFMPDIDHEKVKFVVDWVKKTNWKR